MISVRALAGASEDYLLRMSASLERGSEHPLASAIVNGAKDRDVSLISATNIQSVTGKGIRGTVDGHTVAVGNSKWFAELGIPIEALATSAGDSTGLTFVAIDGQVAGLLEIADPIKPTTAEAIGMLREENLRIVLLSGDNRQNAEAVGKHAV